MKRIKGSDETYDRESLPVSRGHWIAIGRSKRSHIAVRYKMRRNAHRGIEIEHLRCVFHRFNQSPYNSSDRRL